MADVQWGNVPAYEAIENIRSKLAIPTSRWDQFLELPRAKAFTVAGATKMDLLNDLHESVAQAIENGESIGQFRARFDKVVQQHGWSYKGSRGWRTRVIYDNNLRSAHMAGRWAQIQRVKHRRPYLIYYTVDDSRVRDQHRKWHAMALPVDDPWWDTHFPPNGWGCRCYVISANDATLRRLGIGVSDTPTINTAERINAHTGESYGEVPEGIDVGWDSNVGKAWLGPDNAFGEKIMQLPPSIRKTVLDNNGVAQAQVAKAFDIWAQKALREKTLRTGGSHSLGWFTNDVIEALASKDIHPTTAAISISDHRLRRMQRDLKSKKDIAVPHSIARRLPELMAKARAVLIDKKGGLIYVLADGKDKAKVVLEVNFRHKGELTNNVRSGTAALDQLNNKGRYDLLTGKL